MTHNRLLFNFCILVFCLFGFHVVRNDAARILGFFPTPSKSHLLIHAAIADTLAQAGHNVTVISTMPNVYKNAKYNYLQIDAPGFDPSFTSDMVNNPQPFYKRIGTMMDTVFNIANKTLAVPELKQFLRDHKAGSFDMLIFGYFINDFQLGIGAHFQCPIVLSFMIQPVPMVSTLIRNPPETAYVPSLLLNKKQPLNFWQRVLNYLLSLLDKIIFGPLMTARMEKYYEYNFPSDRYGSLAEVKKNISLVLTNHHFISQGPIRPNVPALIDIGGIQIKEKPDPLPADIAKLLDNAKEGVIYFSFGSNVEGSIISKDKAKILFNVFSQLPYKVLWKWGDSDFPGESANILYKSWLPQDDILAHPNIKLFITHGGQGSVVESSYHGVPMVGIPLFGDQHANMASVETSGFGVQVDFATLSEESLRKAIMEVLQNTKYAKNLKEFSSLYRDRPLTPKATVLYWLEYVLRHKGAKHLQSPAVHMNDWQLDSWDVKAFFFAVLFPVFFAIFMPIRILCCKAKSNKNKNENEKYTIKTENAAKKIKSTADSIKPKKASKIKKDK